MRPHEYRPRASSELTAGYQEAAGMAVQRREQAIARGDAIEAAVWDRLADECLLMAKLRAVDDDQFPIQRFRLRSRYRKEIPSEDEMLDVLVEKLIGSKAAPLGPWQRAVVELSLGYLSETQQSCLELVVAGGMSAKEAGRVLDKSPSEVRQHVARAKKTFVEKVQPRLARAFDSNAPA